MSICYQFISYFLIVIAYLVVSRFLELLTDILYYTVRMSYGCNSFALSLIGRWQHCFVYRVMLQFWVCLMFIFFISLQSFIQFQYYTRICFDGIKQNVCFRKLNMFVNILIVLCVLSCLKHTCLSDSYKIRKFMYCLTSFSSFYYLLLVNCV